MTQLEGRCRLSKEAGSSPASSSRQAPPDGWCWLAAPPPITVEPNGRMRIPESGDDGVRQDFQAIGSLLFKVEKRTTQHFEVETPYLTAVVKGTTFTVSADVEGLRGRRDRGSRRGDRARIGPGPLGSGRA